MNCSIYEWKTAFRAASSGYDQAMLKAPTDADLIRLREFLKRLESDAQTAPGGGDIEFCRHEIEMLKEEIAYLEAARSKAFLAQIAIDFGTSRQAR